LTQTYRKDGREVVFRATSRSGPAKVEIIDPKKRLLEKISFDARR